MILVKKIHAIAAAATSLETSGYNDFGKYEYAKESDILAVLKPLFSKHEIAITQSVKEVKHQVMQNAKGNRELFCEVLVEYTILDTSSDEKIVLQGFGTGLDVGDKALYKALTGAHKYFLSKNFNLSTNEDPENDSDNGDKDSFDSYNPKSSTRSFDPKSKMPFGKNKGKLLTEIPLNDLENAVQWVKTEVKKPTGAWLTFMDQVELLKESQGKQ